MVTDLQVRRLVDMQNKHEYLYQAADADDSDYNPSADIAPEIRDNFVDMLDLALLAEQWLLGATP